MPCARLVCLGRLSWLSCLVRLGCWTALLIYAEISLTLSRETKVLTHVKAFVKVTVLSG